MGADSFSAAERAAAWLGLPISELAESKLRRYAEWLREEAITAGGLGPNEGGRIWGRHIADAMTFAVDLVAEAAVVDIGAGVGLPGVPLAILYPDSDFDLVDRSRRRCDLLGRAISILDLHNCEVIHRDVTDVDNGYDYLVSRAALPPERLMIHVKRLLKPSGIAVIGLSRTDGDSPKLDLPPGWKLSATTIPTEILDTAVHILRIVAA